MTIGALDLAVKAVKAIKVDGGFTFSPTDGSQPNSGFAVAIYPEAEEILLNPPTANSVLSYIARWAHVLYADARAHLGGWVSEGKVYLDISAVFASRDEALAVARANGQIAVWDLGKGEEIAA